MSDSLWPHGLQHTRLPCPSPTPGICSNSCPLSLRRLKLSNHLILCHPLLLPSIFPSFRVFSNELVLRIWWSVLELQLQHQSFQWIFRFQWIIRKFWFPLGLFRIDWLDFPVVQGTLKSFLQHHSSKASILWCSAFFIVQLSHPYMTTGKTIALTTQTFVS